MGHPDVLPPKTLFVTVGTTEFNQLVQEMTKDDIIQILITMGFRKVVIQYGIGNAPVFPEKTGLAWESFSIKDTISGELESASMVISHAGAGSVIETLRRAKPLVVVINEELMDNHQTELADALQNKQYLVSCTCKTLRNAILTWDKSRIQLFPDHLPEMFSSYLNKAMGIF